MPLGGKPIIAGKPATHPSNGNTYGDILTQYDVEMMYYSTNMIHYAGSTA